MPRGFGIRKTLAVSRLFGRAGRVIAEQAGQGLRMLEQTLCNSLDLILLKADAWPENANRASHAVTVIKERYRDCHRAVDQFVAADCVAKLSHRL